MRLIHSDTAVPLSLAEALQPASLTIRTDNPLAGWPQGSGAEDLALVVTIDRGTVSEERVLCAPVTDVTGTTLTVYPGGRGWGGTPVLLHQPGAAVEHTLAAAELERHEQHMFLQSGVHGANSPLVGASDAATLTNKTLNGANNTFTNIPAAAVVGLPELDADLKAADQALRDADAQLRAADQALQAADADLQSKKLDRVDGTAQNLTTDQVTVGSSSHGAVIDEVQDWSLSVIPSGASADKRLGYNDAAAAWQFGQKPQVPTAGGGMSPVADEAAVASATANVVKGFSSGLKIKGGTVTTTSPPQGATAVASQKDVSVTHGFGKKPAQVFLTMADNGGGFGIIYQVVSVGTTTFTIRLRNLGGDAGGSSMAMHWLALG